MNKEGGRLNGMAVRAVLSTSDDGVNHDEEWRIWSRVWKAPTDGSKRLSAAIAVKVKEKVAVPVKAIPLHVFFPTEETMAAPFLVHAAFDLTSDRNYLSPQPDASGRQAELIKMLGELAGHATSYLEPASAIELFRPLAKLLPSKKVTRKIERGIFAAVKATAFVPTHGGRLVKPVDARTWTHDLVSVLDSRLSDQRGSAVRGNRH